MTKPIKTIEIKHVQTPPKWALMEKLLFDTLNKAAVDFVNRYTNPDGTLKWRRDWPGMDGSDDPYEGFMNLALLYVIGGSDELLELARKMWEAITWQWTEYGQIHNEFDSYYDWMHHGEGYLYHYFMGLADPVSLKNIQRSIKFAEFYTGENPEVENYDIENRLIRSPITGSKGPRFQMTEEDWCTHRGILDDYLAPFEDIKGVEFDSFKCPWSNDEVYKEILQLMNQRMAKGDVPLNLNATSLVANAFMYTADDKYRQWVIQYVMVWIDRSIKNNGIIPDNVGLKGEIGEYMDGKWWGGYYGWRWPHGFMTIIEPITNAVMNAALLTGDLNYLNLARMQLDKNWELGKYENGDWLVPYKHFDTGWTDFREANPMYPIYLWTVSMADEDLNRITRMKLKDAFTNVYIPTVSGRDETRRETKHYIANTVSWFHFITGNNPDYPEQILEGNYKLILHQLEKMNSDEGNPDLWDLVSFNEETFSSIHIWQELCPLYFEGLVQLTLGGPMHISHGGLQHGRVRYFDGLCKRPGLPDSVSALVEELKDDCVQITLINLSNFENKEVIIQAGTFGEHFFIESEIMEGASVRTEAINDKWVNICLDKGAGVKLNLKMKRYVNEPSYDTPWCKPRDTAFLKGRNLGE